MLKKKKGCGREGCGRTWPRVCIDVCPVRGGGSGGDDGGRPTATDVSRSRAQHTGTDRPAGRSALPCRRVSHSGSWRGGGAVVIVVGAGPARSALSTAGRGPHVGASARAGIAPRALQSSGTVPRPDANALRSVDRHSYDCCNQQLTFSHRVLSFHCLHHKTHSVLVST